MPGGYGQLITTARNSGNGHVQDKAAVRWFTDITYLRWSGCRGTDYDAHSEQNDEGGHVRKRANCLKTQSATERLTQNLIYSTKP